MSIAEHNYYPGLPKEGKNNFWYFHDDSETVFVFVHGIFSDSRSCWLHKDSRMKSKQIYWPDLILRDSRIADGSIFLGGYYTSIDSGPYEIRNCADELYSALTIKDGHLREPVIKKNNIIFICHSTGGIVVRYLLESKFLDFATKNVGLILLASPSYGSKLADRLSLLSKFYNQRLGQQLQWGNWSLRDLDARFKNLLYEKKIPNIIGVEAYENHFIIHRKWLPSKRIVVTEESAGRYFGAPILLRDTDHFTTAKPNDIDHPSHQLLVQFLNSNFIEKKHSFQTPEVVIEDTSTSGKTIIVDKAGHGDYSRIGPAIRSAIHGDKILVREGLYIEKLRIEKQIRIIGDGNRNRIIIEGENYPCFIVSREQVEITNISIKRKEVGSGSAVLVTKGEVVIKNCSISSKSDFGIEATDETSVRIIESEIHDVARAGIKVSKGSVANLTNAVIFDSKYHGLHAVSGSCISIIESKISNNGQCGILLEDAGQAYIKDSKISRNKLSGIQVLDGEICEIIGNSVSENQQGIRICGKAQCTVVQNKVVKSEIAGIHVVDSSSAKITNNQLFKNTTNGVYLSTKGEVFMQDNKIYDNQLAGVEAAHGNKLEISKNKIFNNSGAGVRVYDRSKPMIIANEIYQNRLAGVIIHSEGEPEIRENRIFENYDAGVNCFNKAMGLIQNNEIHANRLSGIIISRGSDSLIVANRIFNNQQCGILCLNEGFGIIKENHIHNNSMSGILSRNGSKPKCNDNLVEGNSEVGICVNNGGGGEFLKNRITENRVGVGLENTEIVVFRANTISSNIEVGIEVKNSPAMIVNNELRGNKGGPLEIIGKPHFKLKLVKNKN